MAHVWPIIVAITKLDSQSDSVVSKTLIYCCVECLVSKLAYLVPLQGVIGAKGDREASEAPHVNERNFWVSRVIRIAEWACLVTVLMMMMVIMVMVMMVVVWVKGVP